ncbi:OsmC family protein [Fluviicola sp.]|uniref:OsmC family protein n=1 Tax=Fluviicola sp. TaxID=1917219 RepID=UPI003D2C8002
MASVSSSIKKELYRVEMESPSGNVVIADEPLESGGQDLGFSPTELLASALAACTSATLRIYADSKGWDLQEVKLEVNLQRDEKANKTIINRTMELFGNLDEKQRDRLMMVANACPVHKILTNPIEINTEYA